MMKQSKQTTSPIEPKFDKHYQVTLPDFYGPMDVLLALIQQEDVEITKISLAQVTDQYLAYINQLQKITPEVLTQFLTVAAKLILIKSQVLLPKPPPSILEDDEEDTGDDLVQQLRDYKRFKHLAQKLDETQQKGQRCFVRTAPPPKIEPKLDLGDLNLNDLLEGVRRALAVKPDLPTVDAVVSPQIISIGDQINLIRNNLQTQNEVKFTQLLTPKPSRVEVIVTLLAMLELIKRCLVDVIQHQDFGEIIIVKRETEALSEDDWLVLSQLKDVS